MAYQLLDRNARLPSSSAEITQRLSGHDDWWMTDAERLALTGMLSELRPECAIELGIYRAGSLAVIARFSRKVYALDVDPTCEVMFADKFRNVEFVTGHSEVTLPEVLAHIEAAREPLGFILIDADHSREAVRRDIEAVLQYTPIRPLYVLLHDSFHPECRKGIREANWSGSSYVHAVELDFVVGRFITDEEPDEYKQMWCGFALAILLPEKRRGRVVIRENESLAFRTVLRHSAYQAEQWWSPAYVARESKYHAKHLLQRRAPIVYKMLRRYLWPRIR